MLAVKGIFFGISVSWACSIVGLVFFTSNIVVSLLGALSLVGNIAVTLGLFWVVGWTLGPIEAISISVLVGLSVDYLLHIAGIPPLQK